MGNDYSHEKMLQLDPYIYNDGSVKIEYNPGLHPGDYLLPPSFLLQYDSLPQSIIAQIDVRNDHYDLYGNHSGAYDGYI